MIQQQQLADRAAGVAVAFASATWITQLNQVLQLVATVVAIVAGVLAARFHYIKAKELKRGDPPSE